MALTQQEVNDILGDMANAQRAALLFIALGQKWATEIMRFMRVEEIRNVSYWINQMKYVPQEVTEQVIKEFYERLAKKTALASTGGRDYLIDVLSGMMGDQRARELADDLSNQEESEVFRVLKRVDPKKLASYLRQEQPQTVALMMSYLEPERAALIIRELPQEVQLEIVIRLAKLEQTDPEIITAMEQALNDSLGAVALGKKAKKVGGTKVVAEILNHVGRGAEKMILEQLSERDFDLATEIRDLMFVFVDIVLLDDKSMQMVLKEVDQADLVMALKGAPDHVKDKVLANLSRRQAEVIDDELSFMGPVKASAVQASQQKIVNVIRKLDEEGKVLIQGKGGGDEVIS